MEARATATSGDADAGISGVVRQPGSRRFTGIREPHPAGDWGYAWCVPSGERQVGARRVGQGGITWHSSSLLFAWAALIQISRSEWDSEFLIM